MAAVGRRTNDLVTSSVGIAGEPVANATTQHSGLNVGKNKIIVGHLFKEMGNGKLVVLAADPVSDSVDGSHGTEYKPEANRIPNETTVIDVASLILGWPEEAPSTARGWRALFCYCPPTVME